MEKLKLLHNLLKKQILSSEYIQIDESVIPVIDNEKHKTRKGYEWCLCDGYDAYEQFERMKGITLFGCWAHARRKFTEALDENRAPATQALCHIGKLYKVESEADETGLSIEERKEKRIRESYPVIREFERWMQDAYLKVLPKSRTGKAIEYTFSLLPRLSRHVNDGRVNIDNNLIENAIRPLALGRKNYLFCGNDVSAYRAAIVYSLIGTCKSAGVGPGVWMEDVMRKIPYYERDKKDMTELLPRNWAKS